MVTEDGNYEIQPSHEQTFRIPIPGLDQLNPRDITVPRMQLVQPTSQITGALQHLGEWYNTATGEFHPFLEAVFCGVKLSRVVFPEVYTPDNSVECSSPDSIRPYAEHVGKMVRGVVIRDDCKTCPLAQFGEDEQTGKPIRPACDQVYVYAAVLASDWGPFSMALRGSAAPEGKRLNYLLQTFGYGLIVKVESVQKEGGRGTYFIPKFSPAGNTPADLQAHVTAILGGTYQSSEAGYTTDGPEASDDIPF